ncbi:hypothetical protein, partial [Bosea sp. Root670]|uniref:hypothetical protein n=1 Tax=Bosea sp. Root670 TaxID=1736583 RepID=UPI001AECECA3
MRLFWETACAAFAASRTTVARACPHVLIYRLSKRWLIDRKGQGERGGTSRLLDPPVLAWQNLRAPTAAEQVSCGGQSQARRRTRPKPQETGSPGGFWQPPEKETRFVKKTSSSVLTSNPGLAYKPAIETAPPLSGASSALPKDAEADAGSPDGF